MVESDVFEQCFAMHGLFLAYLTKNIWLMLGMESHTRDLGMNSISFLLILKSENIKILRKKKAKKGKIVIFLEENFVICTLKMAIYCKNHENIKNF